MKSIENIGELKGSNKIVELSREIRKYESKFPNNIVKLSRDIREYEIKKETSYFVKIKDYFFFV